MRKMNDFKETVGVLLTGSDTPEILGDPAMDVKIEPFIAREALLIKRRAGIYRALQVFCGISLWGKEV